MVYFHAEEEDASFRAGLGKVNEPDINYVQEAVARFVLVLLQGLCSCGAVSRNLRRLSCAWNRLVGN
jgi:hypothetical protein